MAHSGKSGDRRVDVEPAEAGVGRNAVSRLNFIFVYFLIRLWASKIVANGYEEARYSVVSIDLTPLRPIS